MIYSYVFLSGNFVAMRSTTLPLSHALAATPIGCRMVGDVKQMLDLRKRNHQWCGDKADGDFGIIHHQGEHQMNVFQHVID